MFMKFYLLLFFSLFSFSNLFLKVNGKNTYQIDDIRKLRDEVIKNNYKQYKYAKLSTFKKKINKWTLKSNYHFQSSYHGKNNCLLTNN